MRFVRVGTPSIPIQRVPPGLTLFLLAPILGELLSGHQPPLEFFNPLSLVIQSLLYGCGALICRELTVRWEKGWLSLLLLGIAYAVYEEAIVVRSIFNPSWAELEALAQYNHFAGVNWTYGQLLIHFHVLISIGASVTLAQILYPEQRHKSWISNKALAGCFAGLLLWLPIGLWATSYHPPAGWYVLSWLAIIVLIWAAREVPAHPFPAVERISPRPRSFFVLGFLNMSVFLLAVFMTAESQKPPLIATVILLFVLDGFTMWLLLRWSGNGCAWDDRHRLALVAGQLAFFILFGFAQDLEKWQGASVVGLVAVVALWRLGRNVSGRVQPLESV